MKKLNKISAIGMLLSIALTFLNVVAFAEDASINNAADSNAADSNAADSNASDSNASDNKSLAIEVSQSGQTILPAAKAILAGRSLQLENDDSNIGFWKNEEMVAWDISVVKDGKYRVILEYSSESNGAYTAFISTGKNSFTQDIIGTGSWDNYETVEVGEIELDSAVRRLIIGNRNLRETYFVNLKNVHLIPITGEPTDISGSIELGAVIAELEGDDMTLENFQSGEPNICYWYPGSSAVWKINVQTPGTYKVVLNYSRAPISLDLPVAAIVGDNVIENYLEPTNGWDDYVSLEIGKIELSAEDESLIITGGEDLKTDLMNLRYVVLVSEGDETAATELIEEEDTTGGMGSVDVMNGGDSGNTAASPASGEGANIATEIFILAFTGLLFIFAGVGKAIKIKN